MKTIYKYPVPLGNASDFELELHAGAVIRHFEVQHGTMQAWAEVDTALEKETRRFRVFGTGYDIPEVYEWRGTLLAGIYVWHLYENTSGG